MATKDKTQTAGSTADSILAAVTAWEASHIKLSNLAGDDEIGQHMSASIAELKNSITGDITNAAAFVKEWKEKHLHNSVVSRNTAIMNIVQPKLDALVVLITTALADKQKE